MLIEKTQRRCPTRRKASRAAYESGARARARRSHYREAPLGRITWSLQSLRRRRRNRVALIQRLESEATLG